MLEGGRREVTQRITAPARATGLDISVPTLRGSVIEYPGPVATSREVVILAVDRAASTPQASLGRAAVEAPRSAGVPRLPEMRPAGRGRVLAPMRGADLAVARRAVEFAQRPPAEPEIHLVGRDRGG